jgi:prophage regulatory protein
MSKQNITIDKILRLPEVKEITGLGRSSIYAGLKKQTFPAKIKLGDRAVGWSASEVEAWIQSRKANRQQVTA